ncbi:hypothetical protein B7494_g660 [Chlorociboria aeruginascens]|nr:hypothetical protein B7494_g660 [Chlorociboria aeruginascens]
MGGGVASTLYGDGYIAIAHYETSSISTFKLPLTASSTAQQVFTYKLTAPGTIPARQDAPHPHDVIVDPTGAYIIAPDLGADLIHIFSIDPTSGHLTECPSYITPGGTGPRHGAFTLRQDRPRRNAYVGQQLYVSNELANTVTLYNVEYSRSHCLTLSPVQVATTYPSNKTAATGITVAEVRLSGDFLYVSNRNDLYFSPDDSVTAFSIDSQAPTGDMTFLNITSSGGWYPRTFVVNKAGTFVAVGDQTSSNVAIFKRDRATAKDLRKAFFSIPIPMSNRYCRNIVIQISSMSSSEQHEFKFNGRSYPIPVVIYIISLMNPRESDNQDWVTVTETTMAGCNAPNNDPGEKHTSDEGAEVPKTETKGADKDASSSDKADGRLSTHALQGHSRIPKIEPCHPPRLREGGCSGSHYTISPPHSSPQGSSLDAVKAIPRSLTGLGPSIVSGSPPHLTIAEIEEWEAICNYKFDLRNRSAFEEIPDPLSSRESEDLEDSEDELHSELDSKLDAEEEEEEPLPEPGRRNS